MFLNQKSECLQIFPGSVSRYRARAIKRIADAFNFLVSDSAASSSEVYISVLTKQDNNNEKIFRF